MRIQFTVLSLSLCLGSAAFATSLSTALYLQETPAPSASVADTAPIAGGSAVLTRALDTIEADEISADLHFIASDEMHGRDTPSPEQRIAARFIAARLERLGWQPGAQEGWFWEYDLPSSSIDPHNSGLHAQSGDQSADFVLGVDYAFHPRRASEIEISGAEIVFGGTLTDADREGLQVEGRWVMYRSSEEVSTRGIAEWARKSKAVGTIQLPGGELDAAAMTTLVKNWGQKVMQPKLSRGGSRSGRGSDLSLTEYGAQRLLALAGRSELKLGDVLSVQLSEKRARTQEATVRLENVIGIWPGSDPELSKELLIVSAHYDHVGMAEDGEVFNGADDNGSGTVGLMAIAEALNAYGPMRRSVMLMWVSGEEKGLLGSAEWTKNPYLPNGLKPVVNLNIDMIGRNAGDSLLITPTKDHDAYNGLTRLAEAHCEEEGFQNLGSADLYWGRSDHANFSENLKIPVAFLFADIHEDYHQVTDTVDKINFDKIRRVARLVVRMLDGLQTDKLELD